MKIFSKEKETEKNLKMYFANKFQWKNENFSRFISFGVFISKMKKISKISREKKLKS